MCIKKKKSVYVCVCVREKRDKDGKLHDGKYECV